MSDSKGGSQTPVPTVASGSGLIPGHLDEYLKHLKPKPRSYISEQSIFDGVVRLLYKQMGPCIRVDDSTGQESIVNFNMQGYRSPILYCMSLLQLRNLQKSVGYELLRDANAGSVIREVIVAKSTEGHVSSQHEKFSEEVLNCLNENGINLEGAVFLLALDDAHKMLALSLQTRGIAARASEYPSLTTAEIFKAFYSVADTRKLSSKVLQFSP